MSGYFISFEGGDATGKTTILKMLADTLCNRGKQVVCTREPGGTEEAEFIRNIILSHDNHFEPLTQLLLFTAARNEHVNNLIKPALENNAIVLCDRFYDSTVAYQGYGSGIDINIIEALYKTIFQQFLPHLTFILYADYDVIEARRKIRNLSDNTKQDNFESMDKSFYSRVHNGFMEIAKNNPERCILVDVNKAVEEITAEIILVLNRRGVI